MSAPPTEGAVLLTCARAAPTADDDQRLVTLVRTGVEFGTLLGLAERHGVTAFVYAHLSRVARDDVPAAVMEALRHSYEVNVARNLTLAAELIALIRLLAAHDIRALPFTGPVLAQCVYSNLALGYVADIDILVPRQDVHRARELLRARGYRAETPLLPGSVACGLDSQLRVARPADATIVNLRWIVASRSVAREVGIEQLWEQRLQTSLLGYPVPCPSHEHLLLMLCIHGARHAWRRLEWICGLAELVRSKPLDWYRVLDAAEACRCSRMLRVGLLLADQLLDAPVPKFVLGLARSDAGAGALARTASDELFAPQASAPGGRGLRRFQLEIQEDVAEKLRILCYRPITDLARGAAKLAALILPAAVA